ncbi:hypothetical protein IWW36_001495 [Coemansia brasiliensis]|uniref:CsbD-like domain-containing protein n=1 Tax=Coemansia brasiliensis TaxID=2650707 RepID=A0A9W8I8V1_9FUNG|nr:hypothetical protein IWW36_001495 [Coemansia brasiliensis]
MSGFVNKAAGNVQSGVGKIIGDDEMRKRGDERAYQGQDQHQGQKQGQQDLEDSKGSWTTQNAKGAAEQVGGTLKQGAGRAVGNPGMEEAGRETRDKGKSRLLKNTAL